MRSKKTGNSQQRGGNTVSMVGSEYGEIDKKSAWGGRQSVRWGRGKRRKEANRGWGIKTDKISSRIQNSLHSR